MWTLRDKDHVDLGETYPNVPALYHLCLNTAANGKTRFVRGKKFTLTVLLTVEAYARVQAHIEEMELSKDVPTEHSWNYNLSPTGAPSSSKVLASGPPLTIPTTPRRLAVHSKTTETLQLGPKTPTKGPTSTIATAQEVPPSLSRKRAHITSPSSSVRSPPPKRLFSQPAAPTKVLEPAEPEKLGKALQLYGTGPSNPLSPNGCSRTAIFTPIEPRDPGQLIKSTTGLDLDDIQAGRHGYLWYNLKDPGSIVGTGGFKHCILGKLVIHPPPSTGLGSQDHPFVALKRPFSKTTQSPTARLPVGDELLFIHKEAVLRLWGCALLDAVHVYVNSHEHFGDPAQPIIPSVRFVQAGVAKVVAQNEVGVNKVAGAFLVEEQISVEQGFTWFIGNGSAIPISFHAESTSYTLGQFYSFCQHVQWVCTNGLVYCADWQDRFKLPEHPGTLGDELFADGNIGEMFEKFPKEHTCDNNVLCMFFKPAALLPCAE
ncbi:hypothetical protein FRC08_006608 [Ceratobasidium sp. 394]|nr:hypothetical protein FRC08_006608 [Ceratobasidium sp. 394]